MPVLPVFPRAQSDSFLISALNTFWCIAQSLNCVQTSATPWTVAHQAPLSMRFSRQEYWSGLPFPTPGLSCMSRSYILEINPLSVELFASVFSQFVGCLFILFMVSFAVQKLLSLIKPCLFIFVFIFIILGGGPKKILL